MKKEFKIIRAVVLLIVLPFMFSAGSAQAQKSKIDPMLSYLIPSQTLSKKNAVQRQGSRQTVSYRSSVMAKKFGINIRSVDPETQSDYAVQRRCR